MPGFNRLVQAPRLNSLTEKEKETGWELLFDGKTTSGWKGFKRTKAGSAWVVRDGALTLNKIIHTSGQTDGGDILTEDTYENFELILDWKISPCGNSGVIFNVIEDDAYNAVWETGPEMQILDNLCHPDARIEKHRAGDLYDLIESKFVAANPAGEWNQARIVANNGKYEFWLNGYRIVVFEMHTKKWDELVAKSKFNAMPGFGKATKGHIALQDHGDQVWYRNIKIREIQ
jgi:cytochrome c